MLTNSKIPKLSPPINTHLLLRNSLSRTSLIYSLDVHAFHPQKMIEKATNNEDCTLKRKINEISFDKQEEHLGSYQHEGLQELGELIEYYKYYTQSSIIYQSIFFKLMRCNRQQKKAIAYNRLKLVLDLSGSTYTNSSKHKQETIGSSFCLLSQLKFTHSCQQSMLIQKLKNNLQKDYGPSKFSTLQEIDKQFCFSKTIDLKCYAQACTKASSKKSSKLASDKDIPMFKNRRNDQRNNSCGLSVLASNRKEESRSQVKRKKHVSMDNMSSLPRQNSLKMGKSYFQDPRELQLKKKIMGLKEQIRRDKEMLLKRYESKKGKKIIPDKLSRKMRR